MWTAIIVLGILGFFTYICFLIIREIYRFFTYYKEWILLEYINTKTHDETVWFDKKSNFWEYGDSLYAKGYLMTKREALFFRKLSEYIQNKDYIICPKVRLEDIIGIKNNGRFRPWIVSWKLDRSHIDFVLIGKTDLRTKFAIELDDTTHDTFRWNKSDSIKDEAFARINIPLLRFREANITPNELYSMGII